MKKYIILMSAAILAFSCTRELADPNQGATEDITYKTITFEAVSDNTKTTIEETDGEGVVKWEEGDVISIYYWDGEQQVVVNATADAAGTSTTFTAQINEEHNPEYFYATYPADKGALTVTDGVPSFTIDVTATNCDGSFKQANFAAAYTTGRSFQFHNAVGIMKIAIPEVVLGRDNTEYPVTGIYIRCKKTSVQLNGKVSFDPDGGENMFGVGVGDANISMQKLSKDVIASGYVYVPCTPATWSDGLCFRYYSSAGTVPAVLTKDTEVKIQRGHLFPVPDFSSKVVWDYYVASDASEDGTGLSADDPMTLAKLQSEYLAPASMQYGSMRMNGTAINFASGTYNLTAPLAFPQGPTASVTYSIVVNGNGAVLDGGTESKGFGDKSAEVMTEGSQVMSVGQYSHLVVNDLVIQNGYAANGAGVALNYKSGAADDNTTASFIHCKFLNNVAGTSGGAILITQAATGGIVTFNDCIFMYNAALGGTGGALYTNTGKTFVMYNKCSFYKNQASKQAHDIQMYGAECRLGINNSTFNGYNGKTTTEGSLISNNGYTVIANSTVWNSNYPGAYGSIALGCNISNGKANGSTVVSSFVRNATTEPGFYISGKNYQNIKHSIFTGLTEADSPVLGETYTIDNSYDIGVGGQVSNPKGDDKVKDGQLKYMAYEWTWVDGYPCPTLKQVRDAIFNTAEIGPMFLRWLDTIEGSLATDIAGQPRNENAMCPGSYQQATTPSESASASLRTPVKVMSFNILREDFGGTDNRWSQRKEAVLQMLSNQYPDIIGLQECSWTIRQDVLDADPRRKAIGNSVNDEESGYTKTSSNSIIYRDDLYEVVTSGQFWFSDTPDEVSDVFNAPTPFEPKSRTCVWARFRSKLSGQEFYHFNIHLHNGSAYKSYDDSYIADSRTKSLKLLFERIASYNTDNLPVIITGDHNESDISTGILDPSDVAEAYKGSGYTSARRIAPETDTERTLNSFNETKTGVLDHIYVNSACYVRKFSVDRSAYAGVTYISDHYPVISEIVFGTKTQTDLEDYGYSKVEW